MSEEPVRPSETALALRRAFDAPFAEAPPAAGAATEYLLALRLAGDSYAVRLGEIAGLFKNRQVMMLPSPLPHFLGVSGIQGRIVPVHDLGMLLGYTPSANPRWLLLVLAPEALGLAFDSFEGQLRAPREHIAAAPAGSRKHVSHATRTAELPRPIIDLASVVESVRNAARPSEPVKER